MRPFAINNLGAELRLPGNQGGTELLMAIPPKSMVPPLACR